MNDDFEFMDDWDLPEEFWMSLQEEGEDG